MRRGHVKQIITPRMLNFNESRSNVERWPLLLCWKNKTSQVSPFDSNKGTFIGYISNSAASRNCEVSRTAAMRTVKSRCPGMRVNLMPGEITPTVHSTPTPSPSPLIDPSLAVTTETRNYQSDKRTTFERLPLRKYYFRSSSPIGNIL